MCCQYPTRFLKIFCDRNCKAWWSQKTQLLSIDGVLLYCWHLISSVHCGVTQSYLMDCMHVCISDSVSGSRGKSMCHDVCSSIGALTNNGHLWNITVLTVQGKNQNEKVCFVCVVWFCNDLDVSSTFTGRILSLMTWFDHVRDSHSCWKLSIDGACPSLVTSVVQMPIKTIPELHSGSSQRLATQNRKTQANLAENGRGRSAPAQFWLGVGKATRLG